MKKVLFLILIIVFTTSCTTDKDDDSAEVPGYFTVEGVSYDLHKCSIGYWGLSGDSTMFYYMCLLHTPGIYYEDNIGFIGEGSAVSFFFSSSTYNELTATNSPIIPADSAFQPDQATYIELYPTFYETAESDESLSDSHQGYYYACNSGTFSISIDSNEVLTVSIEGEAEKINDITDQIIMRDVSVSIYFEGKVEE